MGSGLDAFFRGFIGPEYDNMKTEQARSEFASAYEELANRKYSGKYEENINALERDIMKVTSMQGASGEDKQALMNLLKETKEEIFTRRTGEAFFGDEATRRQDTESAGMVGRDISNMGAEMQQQQARPQSIGTYDKPDNRGEAIKRLYDTGQQPSALDFATLKEIFPDEKAEKMPLEEQYELERQHERLSQIQKYTIEDQFGRGKGKDGGSSSSDAEKKQFMTDDGSTIVKTLSWLDDWAEQPDTMAEGVAMPGGEVRYPTNGQSRTEQYDSMEYMINKHKLGRTSAKRTWRKWKQVEQAPGIATAFAAMGKGDKATDEIARERVRTRILDQIVEGVSTKEIINQILKDAQIARQRRGANDMYGSGVRDVRSAGNYLQQQFNVLGR